MTDYRAFYPKSKSPYIKGTDFAGREPTVTIESIGRENVEDDKTKTTEAATIFRLKNVPKGWRLNKCNLDCCAAILGDDIDKWPGHKITLRFDPTIQFGADTVGGIRVAGSPELAKPVKLRVKEGRRTVVYVLRPTGGGKALDTAPIEDKAEEPISPDEAREIAGAEQGGEG